MQSGSKPELHKWITIVSLVLITGCGQHPGKPKITSLTNEINFSPAMSTTEKTDFATRYANAWSSQQPANVAAFFSTDGTLKVNDDAPAIGREAITAVARGFMTAFPDLIVSMDRAGITGIMIADNLTDILLFKFPHQTGL